MPSEFWSPVKGKQTLGAIVAAGILVAIFVPFQRAEALSIGIGIPSTVTQSTTGQIFTIAITLAAGEILASSTPVAVVLTPGTPSPGSSSGTISLLTGAFTPNPGTPPSALTVLSISPSPGPVSGPYYYYVVADGWVGPTTVTITALLKTSFLTTGTTTTVQTLDATVSGTTFSQSFTVNPVATILAGSPTGNTLTVSTPLGNTMTITIGGGSGTEVVLVHTPSELSATFSSTTSTSGTFAIGTQTFQTTGELFGLDLSAISGLVFPVDVEVEYDPTLLPPRVNENDLRGFHFNSLLGSWEDVTLSNNPGQNTITLRLFSLSPVAVGFDTSQISTGVVPGGPTGGRLVSVDLTIYPESYFVLNPLARFTVSSIALANPQGFAIAQALAGEQVAISTSFRNNQQVTQDYAYIVQITDQNGFTVELTSLTTTLDSGKNAQLSKSWTPQEPGTYTIKVLVWNKVTGIPMALTSDTVRVITVQ